MGGGEKGEDFFMRRQEKFLNQISDLGYDLMAVKDFIEDKCIVEENAELVLDYLTNPTYVNPLKQNLQPVDKPKTFDYGYVDPTMSAGMVSNAQSQMHQDQRLLQHQGTNLMQSQESLCKVCFAAKINTVLVPCGHRCMCDKCGKVINNECPICRKKVT